MRTYLDVEIALSEISPGADAVGRHLGLAVVGRELTTAVLRIPVDGDNARTALANVSSSQIDQIRSELRNGPNAVSVKTIEIVREPHRRDSVFTDPDPWQVVVDERNRLRQQVSQLEHSLEKCQHAAHLWGITRTMLVTAGCPLSPECYVPGVIADWLSSRTWNQKQHDQSNSDKLSSTESPEEP